MNTRTLEILKDDRKLEVHYDEAHKPMVRDAGPGAGKRYARAIGSYAAEASEFAELIAHRYNSHNDLLEALKAAHGAMGAVASMCQVHNSHTGFLSDVNPYDAYRALLPSMVNAGEILSKYQPVTPA